jgi:uncharacterized protein (TIGR02145 family)
MLPKSIFFAAIIFSLNVNAFAQFNSKLNYGEVKDVDGNTYKTIKIGTQTWMAENLRTTKYNDGSNIPIVIDDRQWENNRKNNTSLPMMCWYNNNPHTFLNTYVLGALYNWYAINPSTNGKKNVCPRNWHIPSDLEWNTLTKFLGGELVAGSKMKSTGNQFWRSANKDATNSSGWTGLPGGVRYTESFFDKGEGGYWWTLDENGRAIYRHIIYNYKQVFRKYGSEYFGYSVRCIMD